MRDPISDVVECALEGGPHDAESFIAYLEECGFMIVPIEDPTNLRFGVDD